ncbi:MAG: 16S rRNA (cytosine(1402)-N(4))-methyltransferase RsmH [Clostridiales bacterium]|nr:16S rRNA (cytosine(1402)-N(4))-methyltransferase RsmH [Clostridiales bacterium]
MEFVHKPVLFDECMENLNIKLDGIYVDGTLGGAGHSLGIAKSLNKNGTLIGIDRDVEALAVSKQRLAEVNPKVILVNDNHKNIKSILEDLGIYKADGILLDLGVSSYQLDNKDRGFSYRFDAPLDMRMNTNDKMTAKTVVNECTKEELIKIFRDYGEEKWSARIAEFIVAEREKKPIETTFELVDIIKAAVPAGAREEKGHPAKRVFQAIRIYVNEEISELENAVRNAIDSLNVGGRLCIITFHSLEDRIVKEVFNEEAKSCICPPDFPTCVCGKKSRIKLVNRKPILPTDEELEINLRAHSAKLRVAEKI